MHTGRIVGWLSLLSLCLALAASGTAAGAEGKTGSIKGEVKVSGVRSPENVLVFIEKAPGEYKPPAKVPEVDQAKLVFIPHVLPVVKGTTVKFLNSDPLLHNVMWSASAESSYPAHNLGTWGKGDSRSFKFDQEGHVVLLCNIHPEMEGHVVVLQNPFFAMVGKDGSYEIKGVPPGEYTVKTWYPQPKKLRSQSAKVKVEAGSEATQDFSLGRK